MSHKSPKIAALIEPLQGQEFDAHYLGYFVCFNQQLFFEAHEVLEELWLPQRGTPKGLFYKGLIQLAGAFVHVQKQRIRPAAALLNLARTNLNQFAPVYEGLAMVDVLELIDEWSTHLKTSREGPLENSRTPRLRLSERGTGAQSSSSART